MLLMVLSLMMKTVVSEASLYEAEASFAWFSEYVKTQRLRFNLTVCKSLPIKARI